MIESWTIEKDRNSMAGLSAYEVEQNGGPGSGNFGHAGRPGKVGGSASTDFSHPETVIIGGSDSYADTMRRYLEMEKRRKLITKMRRMRSLDRFDKAHEAEMRAAGFTDDQIKAWKMRVGLREVANKDKQERAKELRKRAKESPEQKAAIDNIVNKISVSSKDETWLRNNCSPEMAQAFSDEMDEAERLGINPKKIRLTLNDAKSTNGRLGYVRARDEYNLTISKQILRDQESTQRTREASGPNGSKWWTSDKLNGTFSHEIGHAMEWQYMKGLVGRDNRFLTTSVHDFVSSIIVKQAMQNLNSRGITTAMISERGTKPTYKYMSQYGRTNAHESIAESFANPKYSEFTQEIYNITTGKTPLSKESQVSIDNIFDKIKDRLERQGY